MMRFIKVIRVHLNKNMYTHLNINITTLENGIDKTLSLLEATVTFMVSTDT